MLLNLDARVPSAVTMDPTRVRQIIMNGLTNCAKYGQRGDSVTTIELNAFMGADGELIIEALDRGHGLRGRTLADLSAEFNVPPPMRRASTQAEQERLRIASSPSVVPVASAFDNVSSTGAWACSSP